MGIMNFFGLHNESKFEKYFKKAFDSFSPPILADIVCNNLKSRNREIDENSIFFEFTKFTVKFAYNLAKKDMPYIDGRMILVEIKTYEYIKEIFISNYYRMAKYTPLKNKPTRAGELFLILFLNDIDTWTIDFS